jgi:cell division protease FtsH
MADPKDREQDVEAPEAVPESEPGPEKPEQIDSKTPDEKSPNPPRPSFSVTGRDDNARRLGEGDGKRPWRRISKTLAFWVFFVLVAIFASKFFGSDPSPDVTLSYKEYKGLLDAQKIQSAVIIDNEFHGRLITEEITPPNAGPQRAYRDFVVNLGVIDANTRDEWFTKGVDFSFESKPFNWLNVFFNFLPWLLFVGLWLFILRQMQGGPKGAFSFGKSKAKLVSEEKTKITFNDVAGADEAKQELQEIIEFLKDPRKFQRLGGRIPKGVLLIGPPGTGKTHMARAVSGEAEVPFFSMSGSDFVEMFVGVGASRVRDLFEQGKNHAPCIIFIDEIDAVGRHRGAGIGGGHDEREQTLNQLLVEMDGFESKEGVILIAATNRPDVLDPALLRPGRFDRQVVVDLPDVRGREGILKVHTRNVPLRDDVKLQVVARGTPGLSGADLKNLVNEAALLASRDAKDRVGMLDFENAKDKVMMGTERRSMVISDKEKKLTSYHEIGHALVAKLIPESDPLHKVTIIPRGRALGVTHTIPIDDRHTYPQSYCEAVLAYALGGRVAERLVFGEITTGGQQDYRTATGLARQMVCDWGMSPRLGPIAYGHGSDEVFLGRGMTQRRDYSERMSEMIDEEIKRIVLEAEAKADKLLSDNLEIVHILAETLLEFETLDNAQLNKLIAGEKLVKPVPEKNGQSQPEETPETETALDEQKQDDASPPS